ncbi:MAG: serine hydrolase [bacterium]|nr:serine hydrolase [bacterium]
MEHNQEREHMLDYFLWSVAFAATVTGMTLPTTIETEYYVPPTFTVDNELELGVLPAIKLKQTPRKLDFEWGPNITSRAALVMDESTGKILWQKNEDTKMPIASITKLMTVTVVNDYIKDWEETYEMQPKENWLIGARFAAGNGDSFTKEDILKTTLIASANNAAAALAHSTGLEQDEFVVKMNEKADALGMMNSEFEDPTGLELGNQSTVKDLAILLRSVVRDDKFLEAMGQPEHKMTRQNEGVDHPEITVSTTNRLIKEGDPRVLAGKTGFTYEAGHCLATLATNDDGNRIVVILLGGPDATTRFEETQELITWAYDNYSWDTAL